MLTPHGSAALLELPEGSARRFSFDFRLECGEASAILNRRPQMCACLELNDSQVLPGKAVAVWLEEGHSAWLAWAGFSRAENLLRWLGMGGQLVDIPATRFAIRSGTTRVIAWEEVP